MQRENFKIHDVKQGTDEWLALRVGKHTASKAGDAMGVGYGSAPTKSDYTDSLFEYGHQVEDLARPIMEGTSFYFETLETPVATCTIDGVDLLASLDGFALGKIWECKSYGFKGEVSKDAQLMLDGQVPAKHYWQLQHQMMVFGVDTAILTVAKIEDGMVSIGRNIGVVADEADQQRLLEAYKAMYVADATLEEMLESYKLAKEEADRAAEMLKAIEKDIKQTALELGAKSITGKHGTIKLVERIGSVDYKKIPALASVNLDDYRGAPTSYYTIKTA